MDDASSPVERNIDSSSADLENVGVNENDDVNELVFADDSDEEDEYVEEPEEWNEISSLYPSIAVTSCHIYYVFVRKDLSIEEVQNEFVQFEKLDFQFLHQCLRNRTSSREGAKYKLADTLVFHLDIGHEEVLPFLNSECLDDIVSNHFHVMPFLNDIVFEDTPLELHPANTVYFIMIEKETLKKPKLQLLQGSNEQLQLQDLAYNRTKRHYISSSKKEGPIRIRSTRKAARTPA